MDAKHTRGWYLTRIELALAVGAPLLTGLLLFVAAPQGMGGFFGEPPLTAYLVPAVGVAGVLVGLAWMIRIYRGPRDEPPRWRYRDR
jgi:hypothetical protein